MIYPNNFEVKLGFDKIRDRVRQSTLCPLGAQRVDEMKFLTDRKALQHELDLLAEMKSILERASQPLPTDCFFDLTQPLKRIRLSGTFMETEELYDLMRSLRTIQALVQYLNPREGQEFRMDDLVRIASQVEDALETLYNDPANRTIEHSNIRTFPKVAVMGCAVNGPGEAKGADVALCGGDGEFLLFVRGEPVGKVSEENAVGKVVECVVSLR